MKKFIPFVLTLFVLHYSFAQSAKQSHTSSYSGNSDYSSGSSQKLTVSSASTNTNYQQVRAPEIYSQEPVWQNSGCSTTNFTTSTTGTSRHSARHSITSTAEKISLVTDYYPALKTIISPARKINKGIAPHNANIISTLSTSVSPINNNGVKGYTNYIISNNSGSSSSMQPQYFYPRSKLLRYHCVYRPYGDLTGTDGYGVYSGSYKNLEYCKGVMRYLAKKYKAIGYIFDDYSGGRHYHLVMGKYRRYMAALILTGKIRNDFPPAFVIRWSKYYTSFSF